MEDLKACIRQMESRELGYPYQEWYAHTAGGESSSGKVSQGVYLVVVGTRNISAMPVSRSLLEIIQQGAGKVKRKDTPFQSHSGDPHNLPDWVLRHD